VINLENIYIFFLQCRGLAVGVSLKTMKFEVTIMEIIDQDHS